MPGFVSDLAGFQSKCSKWMKSYSLSCSLLRGLPGQYLNTHIQLCDTKSVLQLKTVSVSFGHKTRMTDWLNDVGYWTGLGYYLLRQNLQSGKNKVNFVSVPVVLMLLSQILTPLVFSLHRSRSSPVFFFLFPSPNPSSLYSLPRWVMSCQNNGLLCFIELPMSRYPPFLIQYSAPHPPPHPLHSTC